MSFQTAPQRDVPLLLGKLMAPLPLFPLKLILARLVRGVAGRRPELFQRLGPHTASTYLIDVNELPFVLRLRPDPGAPLLTPHRRSENCPADAVISGPFMELFRIIDGRGDSDAMFFAGNIRISGSTEAAVCLRYALDDLEGSIVDDLLSMGGPLFKPAHVLLHKFRQQDGGV